MFFFKKRLFQVDSYIDVQGDSMCSILPIDATFPDFDSLKIPFFLRSDNQYIVKSADFSG